MNDERNPRGPQRDNDWVEDAKTEISGMAKQGLDHPSTKPVLAGAAIGALAGALLPVVTLPIGLLAGAGFAFWNRIKR
jgi:hypothetical protein